MAQTMYSFVEVDALVAREVGRLETRLLVTLKGLEERVRLLEGGDAGGTHEEPQAAEKLKAFRLLEGGDAGGTHEEPQAAEKPYGFERDPKKRLVDGLLWHDSWEHAMACKLCQRAWADAKGKS